MILYLDTSSLLKLYVNESGTRDVQERVEVADVVATSVIAYPEGHAAVARRYREGALSKTEFQRTLEQFRDSWFQILAISLTTPLYVRAGSLAITYKLRGMDSIHLAAWVELLQGSDSVEFLSYDRSLQRAATQEFRKHRTA